MKVDTKIDEEEKTIRCTLEGVPDVQDAISLALCLRKKASELGFNVIYDARKMQVPTSVMPAYEFSTQLSAKIENPMLRRVKVAFLYDAGKSDQHWKFWETVSINRGLQFKGFTDETDAIGWFSS